MDTKIDPNAVILEQDPFEILGISENISMNDFKIACSKILLNHHPDKGGNEKTYAVVREAIKQVNTYLKDPTKRPTKNPKTFYELKLNSIGNDEVKYLPVSEFIGEYNKEDFCDKFNDKFNQKADFTSGYTLAPAGYSDPRCNKSTTELLKDYQREDFSTPPNMFGDKPFDRNVFNNVFEQLNKKDDKGIVQLDKLSGRVAGIQEYSSTINSGFNIVQPKQSYSDLFTGSSATTVIDNDSYQKFKAMSINDTVITEEDRMKMKEKLNKEKEWRPEALERKPFESPQIIAKASADLVADDYSRKIRDRGSLFAPSPALQSAVNNGNAVSTANSSTNGRQSLNQIPKASWLP